MSRIYNGARSTFLLTASDGTKMIVPHSSFVDIPEKFHGDITYKSAIASGDFTLFNTAKQGDAIERKAHENPSEPESTNDSKNNNTSVTEDTSESDAEKGDVDNGDNEEAPEKSVATPAKGKGKAGNKAVDAE